MHKDRYILKHKIISILGFEITDEEIDLIPLSDFAQKALDNKNTKENILSVVHEACSACMQSQYFVTNMCRGCEDDVLVWWTARKRLSLFKGGACITQEDCVGCGLCSKVCPYYLSCTRPYLARMFARWKRSPKAKTEPSISTKINISIAENVCKLVVLTGRSWNVQGNRRVQKHYRPGQKIIAIPAPAIYGQFNATPGQILSAIKAIGFDDVVEVALGAEDTSATSSRVLGTHGRRETFHDHFLLPGLRGLVDKHAPW